MDDVRGDDVVPPRRQHQVIPPIVHAEVDVRARQDAVVDRLEKPRAAHDRAGQLDDVHVDAVVDADGAGRRAAAQADDERGTRSRDGSPSADGRSG